MPYKQTPSVMSTVSLDNITLKQINACIIGILCYTIIDVVGGSLPLTPLYLKSHKEKKS